MVCVFLNILSYCSPILLLKMDVIYRMRVGGNVFCDLDEVFRTMYILKIC